MENLQILSNPQCRRIRRCGLEVLRIYVPTVTGTTPAAIHAAALINALVTHAAQALTAKAEAALRTAVAQGALLHFTHHELRISLTAVKSQDALICTLSALYKSGQTVYENSTFTTYWSTDEDIQYRRVPKRAPTARTRGRKKIFTFFARHLARTRKL